MEIINEASEKFRDKQEEICGILFPLLQRINVLEKEIYERCEELRAKKEELGIPKNQLAPGEKELKAEYRERLGEIVKPCCTEKLLSKGIGTSFGNPQKYGYIDGECKAHFIMKTVARAVIETHYKHGVDSKHKFVLKSVDGKWLLDEVCYGFESDGDKWSSDNIK